MARFRRRRQVARGCLAVLAGSALAWANLAVASPGQAAVAPEVVGVVPSAATPAVLTSESATAKVLAVSTVGDRVVVGGTFSLVADAGGPPLAAHNLMIYDPATGLITALPAVNGTVETLLPGKTPGTVYVGGRFTQVDGRSVSNLALIDVATGDVVSSFTGPRFNNRVNDLERVGKRLLVGGKFSRINGTAGRALASLSAKTGKLNGWVELTFTGHHNWKSNKPDRAKAPIGITRMAVDPSATRLVVAGNFTAIDGLSRDQIAVIDLTRKRPRVLRNWATTSLTASCTQKRWDSWVNDIAISPDGGYVVVVSGGGPHEGTPCDGAARLNLRTRSRDVVPTWIASTGGDSLLSVTISDSAVYVGGHMRWMNNTFGANTPGPGAVPRPSLAALNPTDGMPLAWNPGRHPRGFGVSVLQLTPAGLFVGSDTDYLGKSAYLRPRLAFLPLSTGSTLSVDGLIPDIYRAAGAGLGGGEVERLELGAEQVSYRWPVPLDTDIDWTDVRGAFMAGERLWTARGDGSLTSQTFDGETVGEATLVAPWADPVWSDQQTGSLGGQTYLGEPSSLVGELPTVTALTYSAGRLFYTLAGSTDLHVRAFNAGSAVVADTSDVVRGVVMPLTTTGLAVQGGVMYVADEDGTLSSRVLHGRVPSTTSLVVSGPLLDGINWSESVLFAGPGPAAP